MKTASVISVLGHGAVLLWAMVSFTGDTFEVTPAESLPVDLVTASEFSELTKGSKQGSKEGTKKPLVEKIDEPKQAEDPAPKVEEKKPEVAKTQTAPPAPQPPDQIAEKLDKPPEKPQQVADVPKPTPRPKPPKRNQPKFDADKIAALLDKREPQRNAVTGEELNTAPALGASSGEAAKLSQSEIDALRARLMSLWNPPVGVKDPSELIVHVTVRLNRKGNLAGPPFARVKGKSVAAQASRDSAVRAVLTAQPYDMLKPEHYDSWKEIELTFDPKDMFQFNN